MLGVHKKFLSNYFLMGASALVLSSCMPDDSASDKQAEGRHDESQVAHYAQAFQQYSLRSLNAVINSPAYAAQTLSEGILDLSASALGTQDLGSSEEYVSSAYCLIDDVPRHLTWFEQEDDNGEMFLKGLGKNRAGLTAAKLRTVIAKENFGIQRNGAIEMADGTMVNPVGPCGALGIPKGSTVAIVELPEPQLIEENQEKLVTRAISCPAGQEGNIMQRVTATFTADGSILVGASSYTSETGVIADNSLSWSQVSNNCLEPTEEVVRNVASETIDAMDVANLITIPGEIKASLQNSLTNKECKDVADGTERTDDNGEAVIEDEDKMYDTCAGPIAIDPLTGIQITPNNLVKTEEDVVAAQCGGQAAGSQGVSIAPGSANFKGVHSGLSGRSGTLGFSAWSGDSAYKKITRFYAIVEDYGDGRGGASTVGNCGTGECAEIVVYEGLDLRCDRNETLTIPCGNMYPEVAGTQTSSSTENVNLGWTETNTVQTTQNADGSWNTVTTTSGVTAQTTTSTSIGLTANDPMDYSRDRTIEGWASVQSLTPNQPDDRTWSAGSMNCVWRHARTHHTPCTNGWTGSGQTVVHERFFTATTPSNGSWSGGFQLASDTGLDCNPPQETGGGDGNCLIAGTQILMADGSHKNVQDIRIGDYTAGGRVLQTYARAYEEASTLTEQGRMQTGAGLFEIDGIIATGRHPFYLGNQWTELSESSHSQKVQDENVKTVYNLLTENHVVPVVGQSGELYHTADDLNNWNNSAEIGRLKLFLNTQIAA
jgi:hypothetical protein